MAADTTATVPSDGGFVVRDAGNGQQRFRVQGDGRVWIPGLEAAPAADRATCFDGPSGRLGPCAAGVGIGATGATGPIGMTGPSGAMGATGATGGMGPTGPAGATGGIGPVGPIGPPGTPGAVGAAGPVGPIGPVGATGPTGAVGPIGPIGPPGAPGATGATGATGPSSPGALSLRDAEGNTLGTVIGLFAGNDSYVTILTSAQYHVQIHFDGRFHNPSELFFASKDCSGTPYLGSGTELTTRRYARTLVFHGKQSYALRKPDNYDLSVS